MRGVVNMEPNKENFMVRMTAEEFKVEDLLEDFDALKEVLWYLDGRRTREIVDTLFDAATTSRKQAAQMIKNLAKLYPLSKPLIMSIMADNRELPREGDRIIYRDASFLDGFDAAESTRRMIIATLSKIDERIRQITVDVKIYRQSLNNLEGERDRLNQSAEALEDLRNERDKLQAEVDKLREEADEEKLRVTLERLESEKRRRQDEIQEQRRRLDKVEAELKALENQIDSSEEAQLIKELLKKFPSDAEDFEQ